MSRSNRLFEIIQILRSADGPTTSNALAETLEVSQRTIYRDIGTLQAMRIPIEGEAGIGYVMRAGFDLPPLMFNDEEIEAIIVGLALLRRTGDAGLQAAANRVRDKIAEVLPDQPCHHLKSKGLYVSNWGAKPPDPLDLRVVRRAIRDEQKLHIVYEDGQARRTQRTISPLAIVYYIEVIVVAAWCDLREDFRHFRADRILACAATSARFLGQGDKLRATWLQWHQAP